MRKILLLIFILFFSMNLNKAQSQTEPHETQQFKDYWYSGKAEITSYNLSQARYGENHDGYAVLIFVTEDFSKTKQVKLDYPSQNKNDSIKILKLNLVKKFNTGIYKYSIMESVFTPVDLKKFPNSLKLTSSSQEWCGHTFTQLNFKNNSFAVNQFSYFESDGDRNFHIKKAFLEDELWTRIRLDPFSLPTGKIKLIPSLLISRLKHEGLEIVDANAILIKLPNSKNGKEILQYNLEFPDSKRLFKINFNRDFPHEIISWEEKYKSGFGPDSKKLTTKAVKNKSLFIDYWNKNSIVDVALRKQLGIE